MPGFRSILKPGEDLCSIGISGGYVGAALHSLTVFSSACLHIQWGDIYAYHTCDGVKSWIGIGIINGVAKIIDPRYIEQHVDTRSHIVRAAAKAIRVVDILVIHTDWESLDKRVYMQGGGTLIWRIDILCQFNTSGNIFSFEIYLCERGIFL